MSRKAYIKNYGCQMNDHDAQHMYDMLASLGYVSTDMPEEADIILVNTCSVRANPENKVYSYLGTLRPLKRHNPETIIGVAGCVAQQAGKTLLDREPLVDFVFGPDNLFRLPELVERARRGERCCLTEWQPWEGPVREFVPERWVERGHLEGVKAYIAITKGCNNHCSFCIVPQTRGREVSRSPGSILHEARLAIGRGAREIWLLGQNVNSYRAEEGYGFYELLDEVSAVEGLLRLRFTSPHPRDWDNRLSDLMAARATICKHLHLPFQAGSDAVLKKMRRRHTMREYLDKVEYLKSVAPSVELSTDLIVGFPGETDEDFERTMGALEQIRFSQVFPFKYSVRPGTAAAKLEDDVPRQRKEERLARVIELQERINDERQRALVGSLQEVLLDGPHPRLPDRMNGRTDGYRAVTVAGGAGRIGSLVRVRITDSRGHWLYAETCQNPGSLDSNIPVRKDSTHDS